MKLSKKYGRFAFHTGTISDRIDISLIHATALKFSDLNFVFAGPNVLSNHHKKNYLNNVVFFQISSIWGFYQQKRLETTLNLPCFVYEFKLLASVGIFPSSLKVLNYLAQKKPIVRSSILEYTELIGSATYYARSLDEYFKHIQMIISNNISLHPHNIETFLQHRMYEVLLRKIFSKIEAIGFKRDKY